MKMKVMAKNNSVIMFWLRLTIILIVGFYSHKLVLNNNEFTDSLVLSYFVNGLLASIIFTILNALKNKYNNILGFFYMIGSFVKFVIFYFVFYPVFNSDGDLSRTEFAIFFIPYVLALILETTELIKILNNKIITE
ncbi:MAG: hypothetical protein KAG96_01155 [Ichthyobacteriaceae bacterium]|nr:hypothetical protein [Ichthyobacteriaceae bacterium]